MTSSISPQAVGPLRLRLLFVLALLAAVAPFATDLYLSAFPRMAEDFATTDTSIQLTLTAFLLGIAVGQLLFGPLSDRVGRRVPLIVGAVLFVGSSVLAAVAPSIEVLIAARLVQGVSGAAGMVLGRAVIADVAKGEAAARALSVMMLVSGVAPVLAPLLGSLLVGAVGWRGVLGTLVILAVLMLAGVLWAVPETLGSERRQRSGGASWKPLVSRAYLGATGAFVMTFTVLMAYISASPFIFQDLLGLTEIQYGLLFGVNALGLLAVSAVATKIMPRFGPVRLLRAGLIIVFAATVVLLALTLTGAPLWLLPIPVFVAIASLGLTMGTSTALALGAVAGAAGTASAVLGAAQFLMAAVASPLVSLGGESSPIPMAIVMSVAAATALLAFLVSGHRPTAVPRREAELSSLER